ncbi:MAG: hypothetical protein FWC92_07285 [Defluviitaleaceae bacterium]|nr:hypothetical protein [Defluviitaleaceae bacterium]
MTTRERVLTILKGKKPDRIPWLADLSYLATYLNDEKIMPDKYLMPDHEAGLHKLHRDHGVGFYLQGYFPYRTSYSGDIKFTEESTKSGPDTTSMTTVSTPFGKMQAVWEYVYSTHSWGPKEFMIKDVSDLKKLRYMYEHMHFEPDYGLANRRVEEVGDNGIVLCYIPKSPIMELIALQAGIETVSYMAVDDEDELNETLAVMEKKFDEACEIVLAAPGDCFMSPDNLSSEVIGVSLYNRYAKAYHQKWCKRFKDVGKYSFVHLDGTIKPLITELCDAGFDVIEAVTPAPVGSVPFEDIRALMNDTAIIWGGIPGGFFHPSVDDESFDLFVIDLLHKMKTDGRCVLGVADQVVPHSTLKRVARVEELVEQYGYY